MAIYPLITPGCGPVFNYLVEKHEELESISIWFVEHEDKDENKDQDEIVLTSLSHNNLKSIIFYCMKNTGDITGRLPSTHPNLEKLQLADWHELSDKGLMKILRRYRSNLRELNLVGSNITGVGIMRGVKSLPHLEFLNLASCNWLIDHGLVEMLTISRSRLRDLDLSSNRSITGIGLKKGVKSLPNLESLDLNCCSNLTDGGLVEILILSWTKLRYLDVSKTSITGIGLKDGVKSLPNLETLILYRCKELVDGGLVEILRISGSKLSYLNVSRTSIKGIGLIEGVKSLPNLETLNLSRCESLENRGLVEILKISGTNLRHLNISSTNLTGIGLEQGFYSLVNLEILYLDCCKELVDVGLVEILRICGSKLRYLNVSWTCITGVGFKDGVKSLPMLENLELAFCDELTEEGLQEILSLAGNRLKIVCVYGERISAVCIETLRIQYPSVQFEW